MQMFDLNEMKRELMELDRRRASLVSLISAAEAYQAAVVENVRRGETPRSLVALVPTTGGRPTAYGGGSARTVLSVTEEVALERIEETGNPVQTRDVIEIMQARRLPLPNKNVVNVVSARLSNSDKLEGRRGLGWWPKGRPWPHEEPGMFVANVETDVAQDENEPPIRDAEDGSETALDAQEKETTEC
jgi:hypothetical protein